ncbi:MAG: hypothetical protein WBP38_06695 [Hyphomicrobium sp.]|jgi:hypothetical protein|nr:hypothetical protein [Hyphomicrobium sp.]
MNGITNRQRALWMVLITSLAAPFFAALIVVAVVVIGQVTGFEIMPARDQPLGETGLMAFAWSALPATIAAIGLTPYVLDKGGYDWLHAAVAGVLAFGASAVIAPFSAAPAMPFLAFLAGVIAIALRAMLIGGGILRK